MKSEEPDWQVRFMEDRLIPKGEVTRNISAQSAGYQKAVGSRQDDSVIILSKAPDLLTWGHLIKHSSLCKHCSCHLQHCSCYCKHCSCHHTHCSCLQSRTATPGCLHPQV